MPLLEYRCSDCGKKTEDLVLAGDTARAPKCSSCGSKRVSRLLSTFAAQKASSSSGAFDASTACGGGACGMP
ncbi:MAG TPA: zinc ribbon domain-containing protein, partial [Thermoanaerobaculia bacterium]|nr:zinc ribbon domain-containing protein [Thermoanaerobaculia bacterium]